MIIASYKENTSWANCAEFSQAEVYEYRATDDTALVNRPVNPLAHFLYRVNQGSECSAYFQWIVAHYDRLPDRVYFVQANPFEHCNFSNAFRESETRHFYQFSHSNVKYNGRTGWPAVLPWHGYEAVATKIHERLFGTPPEENMQSYMNGMFMVSRDLILQHPKKFYEDGWSLLTVERDQTASSWGRRGNGWLECAVFERLWAEIFLGESVMEPYSDADQYC